MNDRIRQFRIIKSQSKTENNLKGLQEAAFEQLINAIVPTVSPAVVTLIILATSYVGIYLVATTLSNKYIIAHNINIGKISETIKAVTHNIVLLAGWVLYLMDKYHKKID